MKKNFGRAIGEVSARLGNTPAVGRKRYIHPAIIAACSGGLLDRGPARPAGVPLARSPRELRSDEVAVISLLRPAARRAREEARGGTGR